jgi:hypothetical protein
MEQILIDVRNDREVVRASQLLKIINIKCKDLDENSFVTICTSNSEFGFGELNIVYVCSHCNSIHFMCIDEEDIDSLRANTSYVIHNNIFLPHTSVTELKKILESDKINPDAPILIAAQDGDMYPLNMVRRCGSEDCYALHLDCFAPDDDFKEKKENKKSKLPTYKLN